MAKSKKKFEGWRWECIDAEVEYNLPRMVVIWLSWPIAPKKNSRVNFWTISLPSANYTHWHKLIMDKLKDKEWRRDKSIPCSIEIESIVWDRVKSDCDNQVASIMDTLVDLWVLEDDNRFIVKEINVKNLGYIKNCWLHRIEIMPYTGHNFEVVDDDHKWRKLLNKKHYLDRYAWWK